MAKDVRLKDVCFQCRTFDSAQGKSYKCALAKSCPGLNWSMSKRQLLVKDRRNNG